MHQILKFAIIILLALLTLEALCFIWYKLGVGKFKQPDIEADLAIIDEVKSSKAKVGDLRPSDGSASENDANFYDSLSFGCINKQSQGHYIRDNSIVNGANCYRDNIVIDRSVSTIDSKAFEGTSLGLLKYPHIKCNIVSIIMHDNVTYINSSAFENNSRLSHIKFSKNLLEIGRSAFHNNNLSKVDLPNSLTLIDSFAFSQNILEDLVIPDSVTSIGVGAFKSNKLSSVKLSSNLKYISRFAFEDNKLKRVVIPKSVEEIDNFAFSLNDLDFCLVYEGKQFQYPRCRDSRSWYLSILVDFAITTFVLLILYDISLLIFTTYCYNNYSNTLNCYLRDHVYIYFNDQDWKCTFLFKDNINRLAFIFIGMYCIKKLNYYVYI